MFDFHLHSSLSFDSDGIAEDMALVASKMGFKEICFTDHYDYHFYPDKEANLFSLEDYAKIYDPIKVDGLLIRKGVEFGLTGWNKPQLDSLARMRDFDFIIGSVHFADGYDPYDREYWDNKTVDEAFSKYLEQTLLCVKEHDNFDVLGHLTYVCKSAHNLSRKSPPLSDYGDITDEIFKVLIAKGIGIEVNTSGIVSPGCFLPSAEFVKRYKELGGEIITVGSDAHDPSVVGRGIDSALEMLKDIFGHVCTFESRKPIFHKL